MLGYGFMGKAHANAFKTLAYMTWPPPVLPDLVALAGRDEAAVGEAARRYGFERAVTDWRDLVDDPAVDVFDNVAPNNLHGAPTIAARGWLPRRRGLRRDAALRCLRRARDARLPGLTWRPARCGGGSMRP